jgi:hypothetical protein
MNTETVCKEALNTHVLKKGTVIVGQQWRGACYALYIEQYIFTAKYQHNLIYLSNNSVCDSVLVKLRSPKQ